MDNIPIFIICHNNGLLVRNSVHNVKKFKQPIIVIDNCSTLKETVDILNELELEGISIVRYSDNKGPWRVFYDDEYKETRKQPFIVTDPDLGLETLPANTVEILFEVQEKYQSTKVGLALDISNPDDFIAGDYCNSDGKTYDVITWERHFWENKVSDDKYDIYQAEIDTTFCLFNFNYKLGSLRVAGEKDKHHNLTVKHLPWHKSFIDELSIEQVTHIFHNPLISTSAKLAWRHKQIRKVKNFIVLDTPQSHPFWNVYPTWEPETFSVFDTFANHQKNVLDIGCWIGPTSLYLASKFQHVWSVDADLKSVGEFATNVTLNNFNDRITILPFALYKTTGYVSFGKNRFLTNAQLNDSTSQINGNDSEKISCLSFNDLIHRYQINNLGLIKVDIEGGEEYILDQVLNYSYSQKVPVYLSFHHSWWANKDLSRFADLFNLFGDQKTNYIEQIIQDPFRSILFDPSE